MDGATIKSEIHNRVKYLWWRVSSLWWRARVTPVEGGKSRAVELIDEFPARSVSNAFSVLLAEKLARSEICSDAFSRTQADKKMATIEIDYEARAAKLGLPLGMKTKLAARMIGCGRAKLYELVGDGHLDARKLGRDMLVRTPSILKYLDSLPRAVVAPSKRHAA